MVSRRDAELLRNKSNEISAAERERILKPYLQDLDKKKGQQHQRNNNNNNNNNINNNNRKKTTIRSFLISLLYRLAYVLIQALFGFVLRLIQNFYAIIDRICAIVYYHHRTPELIQSDVKTLKRLPEHLSAILSLRKDYDDSLEVLMDEVADLAAWSSCAGIPALTIYEKTGGFCLQFFFFFFFFF